MGSNVEGMYVGDVPVGTTQLCQVYIDNAAVETSEELSKALQLRIV